MPDNRPKLSDPDCRGIFSGEVSLEEFLRDYWQQKPLLIRNAFPDFSSPLSPEELAGLSCEADSNARIVIEKAAERPWTVQYGPFDDDTFAELPEDHWTLLVSDVEKHVPEVRSIMDCFRFIPDWRRDDLMFSYAPEGGSVGPHLDAYDVFLLQAYGRRNWMISHTHANQFLQDIDLSILSSFTPDEQWILEPGDMLYLPPGIAHHGVATEDCITCSIGFRAPSVRAMVADYAEHLASHITSALRYTDPGLEKQSDPGEISHAAIKTISQILKKNVCVDESSVQNWFGEYMSEARSGSQVDTPDVPLNEYAQLESLLDDHRSLHHSPASRFIFITEKQHALLFVDGKRHEVSKIFATFVCKHRELDSSAIRTAINSTQDQQTLLELYNAGCIFFTDVTD